MQSYCCTITEVPTTATDLCLLAILTLLACQHLLNVVRIFLFYNKRLANSSGHFSDGFFCEYNVLKQAKNIQQNHSKPSKKCLSKNLTKNLNDKFFVLHLHSCFICFYRDISLAYKNNKCFISQILFVISFYVCLWKKKYI